MIARELHVARRDVVLVKTLVESYEGVASVFGEEGGALVLASPAERAAELDEIVSAVVDLVGARVNAD
jgi:hypothetical protein